MQKRWEQCVELQLGADTFAREYNLRATFFSGEALEHLILSTYLNAINV